MNERKTLKDIFRVVTSNIISLTSAILVGFILPKITTVTDFGYYKTFTLYVTYLGLLHFGFCDGIYLKYSGRDFTELNNAKFRFFCSFFYLMEFVVSLVLIGVSLFFVPEDLRLIVLGLAVYSFFHLCCSFYRLILEATSQFKISSFRITIYALLRVIGLAGFWFYSAQWGTFISYKLIVAFTIGLEFFLAAWMFYYLRKITNGSRLSYCEGIKEVPYIFGLGIPLLITNLMSTFLLVLDRQFVNILFPKDVYAVYAFAYSLLALVTTTTSAVATVLFPRLKKATESNLKESYTILVTVILVVVFAGLLMYFPLCEFINWYLPKYKGSLIIFRIIFPGLAVSSAVTVVMYNYYKVLDLTVKFLKISLFIILFSVGANYLAYEFFHTTTSISMASIVVMLLWYVWSERYFVKLYLVSWVRNLLYMLMMMTGFYLVTEIESAVIGFFAYFSLFLLLTVLFHHSTLKRIGRMYGVGA